MDPFDLGEDLSRTEVVSVIVMVAICLVGAGYIALRLVGLL